MFVYPKQGPWIAPKQTETNDDVRQDHGRTDQPRCLPSRQAIPPSLVGVRTNLLRCQLLPTIIDADPIMNLSAWSDTIVRGIPSIRIGCGTVSSIRFQRSPRENSVPTIGCARFLRTIVDLPL